MAADLDRPDLYVVARFLERLWRDERPHRKTDLQLAVRLNYNVYKKYLDWLSAKGLISLTPRDDGAELVSITPKGLETYKTLVGWIKDTVGDEHL
ncbi:MAG TPA: winged helix-turn-helix domain-containing protein [Candidatus Thermoplasmatota archaeon]|nr:winged helix-turn-helix domain-containing protein [Candidatus Thermoplasmatota archaeon]